MLFRRSANYCTHYWRVVPTNQPVQHARASYCRRTVLPEPRWGISRRPLTPWLGPTVVTLRILDTHHPYAFVRASCVCVCMCVLAGIIFVFAMIILFLPTPYPSILHPQTTIAYLLLLLLFFVPSLASTSPSFVRQPISTDQDVQSRLIASLSIWLAPIQNLTLPILPPSAATALPGSDQTTRPCFRRL
jgi:hypothetical protein